MARYVCNVFSLGMLPKLENGKASVSITELNALPSMEGVISTMGHQDVANIFGLPFNRVSTKLLPGDVLYVTQYDGPRLPEGATCLPEGASFRFFEVEVHQE